MSSGQNRFVIMLGFPVLVERATDMTDSTFVEADPKSLGLDPERLNQIKPAMQAYIDDQRVPNIVTLVARKGQIALLNAQGYMDLDSKKSVTTDSLFRMYSNTKPIAGVATCILYERGILTPDDPVSKFLPEFADITVQKPNEPLLTEKPKRPITIRDLLTNTTGFYNPQNIPNFFRQQYRETLENCGWITPKDSEKSKPSPRDRVRALAQLPLASHPGERFVYHIGYPVLTEVLTAASGQNMQEFFHENIFEPLQMLSSSFYVNSEHADRFTTCYVPQEYDGKIALAVADKPETSEKTLGTGEYCVGGSTGGILTTAEDYGRFGQMLLNGGHLDGNQIISRKTVAMMIGNHTGDMLIPMTGPGFHWGLGVAMYHGRDRYPLIRSVGTYGWGGAAGTTYFADPTEELMGVCLTQVLNAGAMPNNSYQEEFQRLVYQSLA